MINHDEPVFDPLAMVRRRFWSILLPLIGGAIVGVGLVLWLPREYVASATLAATTPNVSGDLAKTPQENSDRTRAISQELLSLSVVEQVAREEGLLKEGADSDAVIAGVRARTQVSLPTKTLGAGRDNPDAFIVSYTGSTAHEAQRVTNRLLKVFIERDSNLRQTRAKDTAGFLAEQLRDSERRMDEAESRLRKGKETHTGLLPEQAIANLQAMSDLRQRAGSNADALRAERDRLAQVEQQLEVGPPRGRGRYPRRGRDQGRRAGRDAGAPAGDGAPALHRGAPGNPAAAGRSAARPRRREGRPRPRRGGRSASAAEGRADGGAAHGRARARAGAHPRSADRRRPAPR